MSLNLLVIAMPKSFTIHHRTEAVVKANGWYSKY